MLKQFTQSHTRVSVRVMITKLWLCHQITSSSTNNHYHGPDLWPGEDAVVSTVWMKGENP